MSLIAPLNPRSIEKALKPGVVLRARPLLFRRTNLIKTSLLLAIKKKKKKKKKERRNRLTLSAR